MSNAPAPAKEPASTSPLRVGILLGVLVLVIALLGYDYGIAQPATKKAYEDVMKLSNDTNARGVTVDGKINAKLLQPADVQEFLKKKPSSVKKEKDHVVEYYWWGGMPHRNFISVLYYGSGENLRFNTHYQNASPDKDDLPNAVAKELPPVNKPPAMEEGGPTKPAGTTEEGTPPKPESTDKPSTDKPAVDKPAEDKPTPDKP